MLQSRCISGCKSDSEFPRELHATVFWKEGFNGFWLKDSVVEMDSVPIKWDVCAAVPSCLWEEEQGACLFQ